MSASATSTFPEDWVTSFAIAPKSALESEISIFSTETDVPFDVPTEKTFGRRVNTFVGDITVTSVATFPAYTGLNATMSPPITFSAVQSDAMPESILTATRGAQSFPIAVAAKNITEACSFFATSAITFA